MNNTRKAEMSEVVEKLKTLHEKLKALDRDKLTEDQLNGLEAHISHSVASIAVFNSGYPLSEEHIRLTFERSNEIWNKYGF